MATADQPAQIDLAKADTFAIGALRIIPPTLEVVCGGRRETLEPRIMQVFVALSRRRGEVVSREDLISQCWDGRSVGDDSINRCIARLRRLSEAEGGFTIETIARVGYRLMETGRPAPEAAKAAAPWWRRWPAMAAAAVVIGGAAAATILWWPESPPELNRVAVLPLAPLDDSPRARVFGAAVTEQIVGVLNENQVQAVSRDQIDALRGEHRDRAARRLGVDFILDGKVQQTPEGLRVIAHLERASSHSTLWTGTFEPLNGNPEGLQNLVAARVVDEIKAALQAAGVKDDAAVAAYLKAKEYAREGGRTAAALRHDQMRIVAEHAPDFSLGRSGLAWSAASLLQYAEDADVTALRDEARREAEQALVFDPHNGETYLALVALRPPRDYAGQEALFRKGLSVEPDEPTLNSSLAAFLEDVGRNGEAVRYYERAATLDPLSPRKNAGYAAALFIAGYRAQAEAAIAHAAKQWPDNQNVWSVQLFIASYGDGAAAASLMTAGHQFDDMLEPDFFTTLDAGLAALAHGTPATRIAARNKILATVAAHHLGANSAIEILSRLGETDAAYNLTEQAFFTGDKATRHARPDASVLYRPSTAVLRRDPRFLPLAERLGILAYWRAHAPDFCRTEAIPVCAALKPGTADRPRPR